MGDLLQPGGIDVSAFANLALLTLVFAYVVGGPAALLCGVYLACYAAKHGWFSARRAATAGAVVTIVGFIVLNLTIIRRQAGSSLDLLIIMLPLGIVSAVACQLLLSRMGALPRPPRSLAAH